MIATLSVLAVLPFAMGLVVRDPEPQVITSTIAATPVTVSTVAVGATSTSGAVVTTSIGVGATATAVGYPVYYSIQGCDIYGPPAPYPASTSVGYAYSSSSPGAVATATPGSGSDATTTAWGVEMHSAAAPWATTVADNGTSVVVYASSALAPWATSGLVATTTSIAIGYPSSSPVAALPYEPCVGGNYTFHQAPTACYAYPASTGTATPVTQYYSIYSEAIHNGTVYPLPTVTSIAVPYYGATVTATPAAATAYMSVMFEAIHNGTIVALPAPATAVYISSSYAYGPVVTATVIDGTSTVVPAATSTAALGIATSVVYASASAAWGYCGPYSSAIAANATAAATSSVAGNTTAQGAQLDKSGGEKVAVGFGAVLVGIVAGALAIV